MEVTDTNKRFSLPLYLNGYDLKKFCCKERKINWSEFKEGIIKLSNFKTRIRKKMTDLNVHLFLQTFNAIKLFFLVVEYLIVMFGQPSLIFAGRPHTYTLKRLTPMSVFLTPLLNN